MSKKSIIEGFAQDLWDQWQEAASRLNSAVEPSDRQFEKEQEAYDALVDYVDEQDLTYTRLDPRGEVDPEDLQADVRAESRLTGGE